VNEMRKRIIAVDQMTARKDEGCLDIAKLGEIEVTSEEDDFPIESAILPGTNRGWRAARAGEQTIRVVFDQPQRLRRILLIFEEHEIARSHQFVLRWSANAGGPDREIVRQQWNFSPPGTVREVEDYRVQLSDVKKLQLVIVPDISGGEAVASLMQLRLA
jgi:hypothetical protein